MYTKAKRDKVGTKYNWFVVFDFMAFYILKLCEAGYLFEVFLIKSKWSENWEYRFVILVQETCCVCKDATLLLLKGA